MVSLRTFDSIIALEAEDARLAGLVSTNATDIDALEAADLEFETRVTLNDAKVGITTTQAQAIVDNSAKVGVTNVQALAITANSAKVGITQQQAANILLNNVKDGITAEQAQAIIDNAAKAGISEQQVLDIAANNDKVGVTQQQADNIIANLAKVGITTTQAQAILDNSDKVGITVAQANAITANTAKVGITTTQAQAILANNAKVGITTAQASAIFANSAKVGITTTQAQAILDNSAKVGITTTQAQAILANNAKVGVTSLDATDAELSNAISVEGSRSNAYADQAEADAKAYADTNDTDTVAFADTANSRIDFGNGTYLNFADIDTDTNLSQSDVATYATAEGFVHSSSIAAESRILADGSVYVRRHPGSPHWDLDGIAGADDQTVEEVFFTGNSVLDPNPYTTQAALTTANLGLAIASTNTTADTTATAAAADLAASSTLTADDSNQNVVILDNQARLDSIGTSDYRVKEIWDNGVWRDATAADVAGKEVVWRYSEESAANSGFSDFVAPDTNAHVGFLAQDWANLPDGERNVYTDAQGILHVDTLSILSDHENRITSNNTITRTYNSSYEAGLAIVTNGGSLEDARLVVTQFRSSTVY